MRARGAIACIAAMLAMTVLSGTAAFAQNIPARASYLEAPALPVYGIQPSGFTVELWVRFRSTAGFNSPILMTTLTRGDDGEQTGTGWSLAICNLSACGPGHVTFSINGSGKSHNLHSSARVDDGVYHHLAATYDGRTARLYMDGNHDASLEVGPLHVVLKSGFLLAGSSPDRFNGFDGELDELRIWSVARSRDEIRGTMRAPVTPTARGLEGYWPFDGDSQDKSPGRNPLVPHNYIVFPEGKVGRAVDIMNEDLFRG